MKKNLEQLHELVSACADYFKYDKRLTTMSVIVQNMAFIAQDENSVKWNEFDKQMEILRLNSEYRPDCHVSQWVYSEVDSILTHHFSMKMIEEEIEEDNYKNEREYDEKMDKGREYHIYHATDPDFSESLTQARTHVGFVNAANLQDAYDKSQNIDNHWNVANPCRSTSVGDVIHGEGLMGDGFYMVKGVGFEFLGDRIGDISKPRKKRKLEDIF